MTLTSTHSAFKPPGRGQELVGHIKKDQQIMIAHEKGFKFHAQPQTGANSCLDINWEPCPYSYARVQVCTAQCGHKEANHMATHWGQL